MLKKLVCTVALSLVATSAIAYDAALNPTDLGIQGFNRSKNVDFAYASDASGSGTDPDVYAIATKHKQGDKIYGTTSASSYIWMQNSSSGTDLSETDHLPDVPNTPSDSAVSAGFSQM